MIARIKRARGLRVDLPLQVSLKRRLPVARRSCPFLAKNHLAKLVLEAKRPQSAGPELHVELVNRAWVWCGELSFCS